MKRSIGRAIAICLSLALAAPGLAGDVASGPQLPQAEADAGEARASTGLRPAPAQSPKLRLTVRPAAKCKELNEFCESDAECCSRICVTYVSKRCR